MFRLSRAEAEALNRSQSVTGSQQHRVRSALVGLGLVLFQRQQSGLQRFQLLARTPQHRCLHIEFLARHQVELAQTRLQHGFEIVFQIAAQGGYARRYCRR